MPIVKICSACINGKSRVVLSALILFGVCSISLNGQEGQEGQENTSIEISDIDNKTESHIYEEKILLEDSTEIDQCFLISKRYIRDGNTDSLALLLKKLSMYFDADSDDLHRLFVYYIVKGDYFSLISDFENELNFLLKARNLLLDSEIKKHVLVNQKIAIIYFRLKDYKSCMEIYKHNLELLEISGSDIDILYSYFGLAECYFELDSFILAKKVCYQSIELSDRTGISESMGFIYSILSDIYILESNIDSARFYVGKGLALSKAQNNVKEIYDNYNSIVRLELLSGNKDKAQSYAELAIQNPIYHVPEVYNSLAEIYTEQGRHKEANQLLQKNIANYIDRDNSISIYDVASTLLKSKYEQENEILEAIRDKEFQRKKFYLLGLASLILLVSALFVLYNQIMTKRKVQKINQDLVERNKNLEQFAFICSHDLKEPIRNIGSFSSLLQQKLKNEKLSSTYDEYFQVINTGTNVLDQIVNSLKIYTEINQDDVLAKSELCITEQINTSIGSMGLSDPDNNVDIRFTNHIKNEKLFSSEYGLQVILNNLISNAIKHNSSAQKTVDIVATKTKKDILITIEDNGPGIAEEYYDQIFLPFKTLRNKATTDSSGLGLAICLRIISVLGGKIWLESIEGKGSKFHVLLNQ